MEKDSETRAELSGKDRLRVGHSLEEKQYAGLWVYFEVSCVFGESRVQREPNHLQQAETSWAGKLNWVLATGSLALEKPEAPTDTFHHNGGLGRMDLFSTHTFHFKRQSIWAKWNDEEELSREFDPCGGFTD